MAKPQAKQKSKHRKPFLHRFAWFCFWVSVILMTGSAGVCVGGFLGYLDSQPPIEKLEYYAPTQVTRVFDRTGKNVIANFGGERREILPLSEIPNQLRDAFIAIEDKRFHEHFGVDPLGILRALVKDLQHRRKAQGGSTITQQMTRTVLDDKVGLDRSIRRKILEATMALEIEQHYSKDQILEFYLNHICLGQGTFGVQSAARTYFGKSVRDLSIAECATLASLPPRPSAVNPVKAPVAVLKRRNLVIDNMASLGMIDEATAAREKGTPMDVAKSAKTRMSYFVNGLVSSHLENSDRDENVLRRGGYQVYTTENAQFQQILEEELARGLPGIEKMWEDKKPARRDRELRNMAKKGISAEPAVGQTRLAEIVEVRSDGLVVNLQGYRGFAPFSLEDKKTANGRHYLKPYYDPDYVLKKGKLIDVRIDKVYSARKNIDVTLADDMRLQGAAVLLDARTAEVLALTGGADYLDSRNGGMFNRATQGGRQPGSCFKPLLYALAVDRGQTAARVVIDDRVEYAKGYTPRNYENRYYGPTALIEALTHSRNVVTVKLFREMGVDKVIKGYHLFDICKPKLTWRMQPELSLCLGTLDVTPLSMAAAYAVFSHQGVATEPHYMTRITDLQGRVVEEYQPRERRVISPQAAYITTAMLMEVMRTGTGRPIREALAKAFEGKQLPEIAGKTGTTTDCVDAWFIGFTPDYILVVCVGFDRNRSLGPEMTGATVTKEIWVNSFKRILAAQPNWKMKFDVPSDIVFRDISAMTGLLVNPDDPSGQSTGEKIIANVPFVSGTQPTRITQGYSGPAYWLYQDPDPKKNRVSSPSDIPADIAQELSAKASSGSAEESSDEVQVDDGGASEEPGAASGERVRGPQENDSTDDAADSNNDLMATPW